MRRTARQSSRCPSLKANLDGWCGAPLLSFPRIRAVDGHGRGARAILTAVSEGDLMPGEAVDVNKLATLFVRAASGGAPSNELLALAKLRLAAAKRFPRLEIRV